MSCVSCFSCVDKSGRRSSIINEWAGEASVFGVTSKCASGGLRVSDERVGHEGKVSDGKQQQVLLCRFFFFSTVAWSISFSCGVYLEC